MSQRTTGERHDLVLKPASEIFLDQVSIERFRSSYRAAFGNVIDDDPLYSAVSEGRRFPGMEHWLPFFHERMETLFDYLPGALLTLDAQVAEARDERLAHVRDFYEARQQQQAIDKKARQPQYKPVAPDALYLDATAWDRVIAQHASIDFRPFVPAEGSVAEDAGGRPRARFCRSP